MRLRLSGGRLDLDSDIKGLSSRHEWSNSCERKEEAEDARSISRFHPVGFVIKLMTDTKDEGRPGGGRWLSLRRILVLCFDSFIHVV